MKGEDGEVRFYSFEWNDRTEAVEESTQLNPQAQVFVPRNDTIDQENEYQRSQAPRRRNSRRRRQLVMTHAQ